MTVPSILVANERRKAIAGSFNNLGTALTGATAVKLYSDAAFSSTIVLWSFGAFMLIHGLAVAFVA